MDQIERNICVLLDVIRTSEVHQEYKKQEEILKRDPGLKERVDQFRAKNFRLQEESNHDELFQVVEQLVRESAELRKDPRVNAYLDAELALCKLMQKVCRELTMGVDMHIPEL